MNENIGGCWQFGALHEWYPEANIQGEFYYWCRVLNINCCLEMTTPVGRLDIAVLDDSCMRLRAIVECKNPGGVIWYESKQMKRYKQLGVPVFGMCQLSHAEPLARKIKDLHWQGVDLSEVAKIPRMYRRNRRPNRSASKRIAMMLSSLDEDVNYRANG